MIKSADIPALVMTLVLAAVGGGLAYLLHLPLGWLLGALLATGALAAVGRPLLGQPIFFPQQLRLFFVPAIGVSIGGNFTADIFAQAMHWWPSVLALLAFIPLMHWVGYQIYHRGGLPQREAFFGAIPGGLIESVQLGEEAGADLRLLTVLQFLRLILTIIAVPVIFTLLTGHAVGSAAGVQQAAASVALLPRDVIVLILCGIIGALLARKLRFPAWAMTGPMLASAVAHVLGWVHGVPPAWVLAVTQVVVGAGLGAKFAGVEHRVLRRAGGLAVLNAVACLVLASAFAWVLAPLVDQPVAGVFLAYAPGGLAEMGLIALSLNVSAIYVTVHHVLRIGLSVFAAQMGARRLRA